MTARTCQMCDTPITYTGKGQPPKYCPTCREIALARSHMMRERRVRDAKRQARLIPDEVRACANCEGEIPPGRKRFCSDDCMREWTSEQARLNYRQDEIAAWNTELNRRKVSLAHDPDGLYKPGSMFTAYDVLLYGHRFEPAKQRPPMARDCWTPGTRFEVRTPTGVRLYEISQERRVVRVQA